MVIQRGSAHHGFFYRGFKTISDTCTNTLVTRRRTQMKFRWKKSRCALPAMKDIICHVFRWKILLLLLNFKTWRLDGSYYFLLIYKLKWSKHDYVTSATDSLFRLWELTVLEFPSYCSQWINWISSVFSQSFVLVVKIQEGFIFNTYMNSIKIYVFCL